MVVLVACLSIIYVISKEKAIQSCKGYIKTKISCEVDLLAVPKLPAHWLEMVFVGNSI